MRGLGFLGISSAISLCAPLGCGDPFSTGTGGAGGGSTTTSTTSGMGGDGGAGGATTTSTGVGGEGGQGGCATCQEGEYCDASQECRSCGDLSADLAFGEATPLPVTGPGTAQAFPRVRLDSPTEPRLVYVAWLSEGNSDLATATESFENGAAVGSATINTDRRESGPLYLPDNVDLEAPGLGPGPLVFDGEDAGTLSRKIYGVSSVDPPNRVLLADLNIHLESYSPAIAFEVSPKRYWFMNKRLNMASIEIVGLITRFAGQPAAQFTAVNLTVPASDGNTTCGARGGDLAPWVTPDGTYLFFHSMRSATADCNGSGPVRSFYVKLNASGLPAAGQATREILPESFPGDAGISTPSLSPDMCTLYFATTKDGPSRMYSAPRI